MKFLIAVASLVAVAVARPGYSYAPVHHGYHGPAAPLAHDGRVVDTPEVAHAKAAHIAAHAEAASKVAYAGPAEYERGHYGYAAGPVAYGGASAGYAHAGHGYHGPAAPLDHEGRVIDTPEVAHLKAAHFAAHADAASRAHYAPDFGSEGYGYASAGHGYAPAAGHGVYHGPAAPLAHDGRVVDTPEVAHAKAAHFAAYADAAAHAPHHHSYGYAPAAYGKW